LNPETLVAIRSWVTDAGLTGMQENDLLRGFAERIRAAGTPINRAILVVDTLHPVHEGRAFRWRSDQKHESEIVEYGRSNASEEDAANWRRSPFYQLLESGETVLRRNMARGDSPDFPVIEKMRNEGQTDYVVMVQRFTEAGTVGEMDCIYSAWSTDAPEGFLDGDVDSLVDLMPTLALAVKCASLFRIAGTLVETYLGRDAGKRVLDGRIERGTADKVSAVLWWSDLRGFTGISDTAAPEQIMPMLNDYAEAIISSIHDEGGDVLKLIGDGILAVFEASDPARACQCALQAATAARARIEAVNGRRSAQDLPITDAYLALHFGDVFYGNIGSLERLDFTVIGPSVNMVNRIATMCRSAERKVLLSSNFVEAAPQHLHGDIVSVGRFALRGFADPQELFTIIPSAR